MNTTSSPTIDIIDIIHPIGEYAIVGWFSTTTWLKKIINEDRIKVIKGEGFLRWCLCDGHWGSEAAERVLTEILSPSFIFPKSREEALFKIKVIEESLFLSYGSYKLNGVDDTTPETAFVAFELSGSTIRIFSYWDCRLFLLGKMSSFHLPTISSWIGSFSYLWLRSRIPVTEWVFFTEIKVNDGDIILFFSDGVDECIYEKTTLTFPEICNIVTSHDSHRESITTLMSQIYHYWAEDNASIWVLRVMNQYL